MFHPCQGCHDPASSLAFKGWSPVKQMATRLFCLCNILQPDIHIIRKFAEGEGLVGELADVVFDPGF